MSRSRLVRGISIRIQCVPPPPPPSVPVVAESGKINASTAARLLGGLLAASETLPFLENESNGLLHAWWKRSTDTKKTSKNE